jgi:hypothetical protein
MLDDSNFPAFLKVLSNNFSLKVLLWKKGERQNYLDLLNMIDLIINRKIYISLNIPK